jgi:hypothetical protein
MNKLEPWAQQLADKILHDLPEGLAVGVAFSMHEGGDALVVSYPASWTGQPEFLTLDRIVRSYGAAFVSRGKGKSFYMVPRPKPQPTVTQVSKDDKPTVAEAPKPTSTTTTTSAPQSTVSQPSNKPVESKPQPAPKQESPLEVFKKRYCATCGQEGIGCDPEKCVMILKVLFLDDIRENLSKLANRPVYSRSGSPQRKDPPRERHDDGGISWFWNDAKTYEKALEAENKNSKEFAALKTMLTDAATAGKKGLVVGAYWCFLDSFKKDGILRKKAQDFGKRRLQASECS